MRRCGKQHPSREAALASRDGQRPGRRVPDTACQCGSFHVRAQTITRPPTWAPGRRRSAAGAATGLPKAPSGFTPRIRLVVRTRAGLGDPDQARCESCGAFLGRRGGQFQHRDARGIGGSRNRVINGCAGAALLCGTRYTGCHGLCEDRDPGMKTAGWWIPAGRGAAVDPRLVPVELWTPQGPVTRWLGEDGTYLNNPPEITELAA